MRQLYAGLALKLLHVSANVCGACAADRSREQVLEAFGAWLRVAAGSAHLDGAVLAAHPLTAATLAGLQVRLITMVSLHFFLFPSICRCAPV